MNAVANPFAAIYNAFAALIGYPATNLEGTLSRRLGG
jgi:hypothetical protein